MALVSNPPTITTAAAQQARNHAPSVIALAALILILYYGRLFFITSIAAVTIAFMLDPFVTLLTRLRMPRALGSFVVCSIALAFLYILGVGAYTQLSAISEQLPQYGDRIGEIVETVQQQVKVAEERASRVMLTPHQREQEAQRQQQQQEAAAARKKTKKADTTTTPTQPGTPQAIPQVRIYDESSPITSYIAENITSFYQVVLMVSFVPFLVYFMLSWRDHLNRSFLQFFHGEDRVVASRSLTGIAEMVRGFVVGNFLLGIILAMVSSVAFWWMRLPFPLLAGPLSGLLSLVPYIGLPMAMIPPMFTALAVNKFGTYVLVVVVVSTLHLIALNLLYPKVVGSRVHLNPLVVTFSLMLWGFLWDAAGLVLAIPLTAGLKAVCDNVKELRPIGKFLGD